jgi:hypothetical protein
MTYEFPTSESVKKASPHSKPSPKRASGAAAAKIPRKPKSAFMRYKQDMRKLAKQDPTLQSLVMDDSSLQKAWEGLDPEHQQKYTIPAQEDMEKYTQFLTHNPKPKKPQSAKNLYIEDQIRLQSQQAEAEGRPLPDPQMIKEALSKKWTSKMMDASVKEAYIAKYKQLEEEYKQAEAEYQREHPTVAANKSSGRGGKAKGSADDKQPAKRNALTHFLAVQQEQSGVAFSSEEKKQQRQHYMGLSNAEKEEWKKLAKAWNDAHISSPAPAKEPMVLEPMAC